MKSEEIPQEQKGLAHAVSSLQMVMSSGCKRLGISHRMWEEEEESLSEIYNS